MSNMPNRIIYFSPNDAEAFSYERFLESLKEFGEVDEESLRAGLEEVSVYDPLHVSRLVEVGVNALKNEEDAKAYYERYHKESQDFERLRRITGYLVGTLSRWNDAKQAEEKARVKHSVGQYTLEEKAEIEALKLENSIMAQF